jgi:peptidyl-prolyl cis-trans isomerase D
MYRFFRKNPEAIKKYLLIFFLGVVSIGMVLTLAPIPGGDTSQADSNVLATISGQKITTQDLQRNIDAQLRNSPLGSDPRMVTAIAQSTLDEMVLQRALLDQAKSLGIVVSNEELMQALHGIPYLFSNGSFIGMDQYQNLIQQETGMTVPQFEAQLRDNILMSKIRSTITDTVQVSPAEVHQEYERRNTKARIAYVLFDAANYEKNVQVTPDALAAYFKANAPRYKLPEQRQVRYVLITADQVRSQAVVTDAQLQAYYNQHLADYRVPDRVHVAHILFKTTGKSPADVAKISATAASVLAQAKSGADFGELARKYSEDTTAQNGGDLGWIVRGQTVKEFEDAAFSMKAGQISNLIKTVYGYHILKVIDRQTAHLQTFDEVKDSIRATMEKQALADAQQRVATNFYQQAQARPSQFEAIARNAGLTVKETPLFKYDQAVPDLGNNEGFQNLAFQLRQGEVGTPLTLPMGTAVIQLANQVPEHVPQLDEVRAQVEQDYRKDQSQVLAAQKAADFAARCKNGDFAKLAKADGLTVKTSADFTEQQQVEESISGSMVESAFTLAPGQTSGVVTAGEHKLVFQVVSHTPASQDAYAAQKDQIEEELLQQKRALNFELYRQNLKSALLRSGKLKMNEAAIKQFVSAYEKS